LRSQELDVRRLDKSNRQAEVCQTEGRSVKFYR